MTIAYHSMDASFAAGAGSVLRCPGGSSNSAVVSLELEKLDCNDLIG